MAIQRYRYRMTQPTTSQSDLRAKSDSTVVVIGQTQGQILDIDVEETLVDDLDDYMELLGYVRIAGPGVAGVPGDVAEFVRRTGDTMTGNLILSGGATVTGLPSPVADADAASKGYVDAKVIAGRIWREAVLVKEQLLDGGAGGVLQAILQYLQANLTAGDTFVITDGTTTETYTATAGAPGAFEFQVGGTAAITQTNLVASINANSALWSAIETTGLDAYFSGAPTVQFVVYRTVVPAGGSATDRVYGTLAGGQSNIQVVEFATSGIADYTAQAGTQSDLPNADPAAKRFGFGRDFANLISVETHLVVEDYTQWTWDSDDMVWQLTGAGSVVTAALLFGSGNILSTATDRYLYPSYTDDIAQVTAVQYRVPRNGSIRNLRVHVNIVSTDATNITYRLRVNGVPTALTVTFAANTADGSNLANSVVVSAGDLVDLEVVKAGALAGGPTNAPQDIAASLEYAA